MKTEIKTEPGICTFGNDQHKHEYNNTGIKLEPDIGTTDNNKHKRTLSDAVHYALNQLKEEGVITSTVSETISAESEELGQKISRSIRDLTCNQEPKFVEVKAEPVAESDSEVEIVEQSVHPEREERAEFSLSSDDDYTFEESAAMRYDVVPWDVKVKAVTLATLYPRWSLDTIRKKTTPYLRTREQLLMWKRAVRTDSIAENYSLIGELVYKRFLDACSNKQTVTTEMLRNWGIEASRQFVSPLLKFKASDSWIFKLQSKYNIRKCNVTGFLKL